MNTNLTTTSAHTPDFNYVVEGMKQTPGEEVLSVWEESRTSTSYVGIWVNHTIYLSNRSTLKVIVLRNRG